MEVELQQLHVDTPDSSDVAWRKDDLQVFRLALWDVAGCAHPETHLHLGAQQLDLPT
jgi:hypothetical protein